MKSAMPKEWHSHLVLTHRYL